MRAPAPRIDSMPARIRLSRGGFNAHDLSGKGIHGKPMNVRILIVDDSIVKGDDHCEADSASW